MCSLCPNHAKKWCHTLLYDVWVKRSDRLYIWVKIQDGHQDGRQNHRWDTISSWEHQNLFSGHPTDSENVG